MARPGAYRTSSGDRLPSVTQILKLCGMSDYFGVSGAVLLAAAQRGSEVHDWTELLDLGLLAETDEPDPSIAGYVAAYLRFRREAEPEWERIEQPFVSEEYRFGGTPDRIGRLRALARPSEPIVVDVKCVAMVQKATRLQVAGYSVGAGVKRRASLQLRPDGTYRFKEYRDEEDVRDWLSCVRVAHFKLRHEIAALED